MSLYAMTFCVALRSRDEGGVIVWVAITVSLPVVELW